MSFGTWGFKSPFAHKIAVPRTADTKVTNSFGFVTFVVGELVSVDCDEVDEAGSQLGLFPCSSLPASLLPEMQALGRQRQYGDRLELCVGNSMM